MKRLTILFVLPMLLLAGCTVRSDPDTNPDVESLWGNIECVTDSRVQRLVEGDIEFTRITVNDGDDFYGERCELGRNERRYGLASGSDKAGTFWLYREGEHARTTFRMRLPSSFPISTGSWQVVMQMKQAQPYGAIPLNTPVLALEAKQGRWIVANHGETLWNGPTARLNVWVPVQYDVAYSADSSVGQLQVTIDGVQSPAFRLATLSTAATAGYGLNVGDPIPSHLRVGVYHDSSLPGTRVDVDDVQVASDRESGG